MALVSGTTVVGDGWKTQRAVNDRVVGTYIEPYGIVAGLVLGGTILGYYFWIPDPMLGALVGGFSGVVLQYPAYRWAALRNWRKALEAQYGGVEFPITAEVTPEALTYDFGDVRSIFQWCGVSDLFWNNGYWIFIAQMRPVLIPQKLFADRAAESAFVAEALSYMVEEARARSPQAVEFAAKAAA